MRPKARHYWGAFLSFAVLLFCFFSSSNLTAQTYFGEGATQDEVVAVMGVPTRTTAFPALMEETWNYQYSTVDFRNGRVVSWDNSGNLLVSVGQAKTGAAPFTQGSDREHVIAAMGTPTRITGFHALMEETWYYRNSTIGFKNGKVVEWDNLGNLRVNIGQAKTNAAHITQGSNREDVIAAMGTPTRITGFHALREETWYYRNSTIGFKNGKVVEWTGLGVPTTVTSPRRIVDLSTGVGVLEKSASALYRATGTTLGVAENGSYYGQPNAVGVPKTVHVNGYFRKDGTYVRGHYRSSPGRSSGRR